MVERHESEGGNVVKDLLIEDELRESYLKYAMSVIVARALPDARDGLKPSQRRILVAMSDLNLGPRAKHRKCAKICGDTSGNYHPHGQEVVYPTLVRMAQEWNMRYPLIDPQGNFGSVDPDRPAAMRYTEARMAQFAALLLEDIDEDTVDKVPNYDEVLLEPVVLPAKFPNLLVNGATGIAVGLATSIPPHNLTEIIDGIVHLIENPDCTTLDLLGKVRGPDFPTGAQMCNSQRELRSIYSTGRGRLVLRSRVHVEQDKRGDKKTIIVTEIPYQVGKNRIIESIADGIKARKIEGAADVVDLSDREGLRIAIPLRRGEDDEVVLNQLFQYTPLQSTFSVHMIALVNGRPRTLNLKEFMEIFRDHRIEVVRRRTRFRLRKAEAHLHILEGIIIAVANIDEVVKIIRESSDTTQARTNLMERFSLSERQAQAILDMRLGRLTALEIEKLHAEREETLEKIREYRKILSDVNIVLDIIREDLYELKEKHGDARRTQIIGAVEDVSIEDLIREEDMAVSISHAGYTKRQPLTSYRAQRRGGKGVRGQTTKEEDWIEHLFIASTHDYLLFLTDRGRLHWLKVYDIPQLGRAAKGRAVVNLIDLEKGEKVTSMIPVRTFDPDRFLVLATRKGTIKKTSLDKFSNVRKVGIRAINLDDDDHLIGAALTDGSDELLLATRRGQAIRFNETDVRGMGRIAGGVRGAKLAEGDEIVALVKPSPGSRILTVCENGYGKQTDIEVYRKVRRGAKGVININTSDRNGLVVACMAVWPGDQIMVMTTDAQVVRTNVDEIRPTGRNTQGVKIVSFREGQDKVASVARVARENVSGEPDGSDATDATAADGGEPAPGSGDAPDEGASDPGADERDDAGETGDA